MVQPSPRDRSKKMTSRHLVLRFTWNRYMIFPRLFTCPTLATDNFKVEFEVNVVIVLQTGDLITENFPIKLVRA